MSNLIDGTIDFSGGQNSGLIADRIETNQFEKGVNISVYNGAINSRARFIHQPITVTTDGEQNGYSYQAIFDGFKFGGERRFIDQDKEYLISVRGGIIFKVDLDTRTAQVVRTSTDDRISINHRRVDIATSGPGMIIADYPSMPVILDRFDAHRSTWYDTDVDGLPAPEVPPINMGVYVQNRFWGDISGRDFTAGDFVGDVTNTDAWHTFQEVFTANAPYVDQIFNLGHGFGNTYITSMGYLSSRNSNSRSRVSEYGSLYIGTKHSIHVYSAELPRAQWTETDFGHLELYGVGIVGQRAHSIVGSDVIFQSPHGRLHSFSKNQSDARQGWITTIISREVNNWLETNNKSYLDIGFITLYDNKIFIGAKPIRVPTKDYLGNVLFDYCHEGMVVLELDNSSSMYGQSSPSWAGVWTGIRPMEATEIENKLYITSKDEDGYNRTYLVDPDKQYDLYEGYYRKVKSRVYLKSYDHQEPFFDKKEHSVDVFARDIEGAFKLTVNRKPITMNRWAKWGEFEADSSSCRTMSGLDKCTTCEPDQISNEANYSKRNGMMVPGGRISFGTPDEDVCGDDSFDGSATYTETQVMLQIEGGSWTITKVRLKAEAIPESDGADFENQIGEEDTVDVDCNFVHDLDLYSVVPRIGEDDG